ncbi:MAG: membrane protein insertase YidC [Thermoleophilia bacterium]|nr:membrane protein insertase YidC [Thermoleophilia bacterium]
MQSLFQPLSDFFFWILRFIHENLGLSWSWSIVVLTVIVRVVLIPLTWRQIKSMRAMQALQPQIRAIQEKYKEDRQVLNQKLMEFYQENKVSPFGSCLPLILQLPVFLGLYYMLRQQGTPGEGVFASPNPTVGWLWIHDITKFDIILMFLYIASQFVASMPAVPRKERGYHIRHSKEIAVGSADRVPPGIKTGRRPSKPPDSNAGWCESI